MQICELYWLIEDAVTAQRTLRLRIGAHDVVTFCNQATRELRPKVVVPGYCKGKGPLALIVKHKWDDVRAKAFSELKSAALKQVLEQMQDQDKPFTPPEVVDQDGAKLRYGAELQFAAHYLVDPAKISQHPEQPEQHKPCNTVPGGMPSSHPIGVPLGPQLPTVNIPGGMPAMPNFAAAPSLAEMEPSALETQPEQLNLPCLRSA